MLCVIAKHGTILLNSRISSVRPHVDWQMICRWVTKCASSAASRRAIKFAHAVVPTPSMPTGRSILCQIRYRPANLVRYVWASELWEHGLPDVLYRNFFVRVWKTMSIMDFLTVVCEPQYTSTLHWMPLTIKLLHMSPRRSHSMQKQGGGWIGFKPSAMLTNYACTSLYSESFQVVWWG